MALNPSIKLPNGGEFKTWKEQTVYTKTYYVDQNNSQASDDNIGSKGKPFLTINKAAFVSKA